MSQRRESVYVTCPECGAFRGSQCRTLTGEKVAGGKFHMARAVKVCAARRVRKAA